MGTTQSFVLCINNTITFNLTRFIVGLITDNVRFLNHLDLCTNIVLVMTWFRFFHLLCTSLHNNGIAVRRRVVVKEKFSVAGRRPRHPPTAVTAVVAGGAAVDRWRTGGHHLWYPGCPEPGVGVVGRGRHVLLLLVYLGAVGVATGRGGEGRKGWEGRHGRHGGRIAAGSPFLGQFEGNVGQRDLRLFYAAFL